MRSMDSTLLVSSAPAETPPHPALRADLSPQAGRGNPHRDLAVNMHLDSDQSGRYVLVVTSENAVEQRKVQTGPIEGGLRVIESGIKPDDRVVIAGLLRAIPGQKVDPQLQKIEQPQPSAK